MKTKIEIWTIKNLLDLVEAKKLDLQPPYQRNPIWTKAAQRKLIQSIRQGFPIPNIFLYQKSVGVYEMVDGQQRTRAFKSFAISNELDTDANDAAFKKGAFLQYQFPVTIITEIGLGEFIEEFYDLVNSSGVRLNRPETNKAKYSATNFLRLVEELANDAPFQDLEITPVNSQKRMMDRDLVEELCALLLYGITDKKLQVDKLFQSDISNADFIGVKEKFREIVECLTMFNKSTPIKKTRYRQRNDIYTLFGFIKDNLAIDRGTLLHFYDLLLQIEKGIRPSKFACKPLSEYALNCVSQSNSSKARQARLEILNNFLLNLSNDPNPIQTEIIDYYSLPSSALIKMGQYLTFDANLLGKAIDKKEIEED